MASLLLAGNGTPASVSSVDIIGSSLSDLSLFDTDPSSVDDARGPLAYHLEQGLESSPTEDGELELSAQQMRRLNSDMAKAASPARRLGSLSPESDLHGQVEYKVRMCERQVRWTYKADKPLLANAAQTNERLAGSLQPSDDAAEVASARGRRRVIL